jgi:hypothetical protein
MQPSLGAPLSAASRCIARPLAILVVFGLLLVAGCEKPEEIEHYRVTRPEPAKEQEAGAPAKVRILGGILPDGDKHWYLKLMGPVEEVAKHEGEFDQFVRSVRVAKDGEPPITWTVPEGWREGSLKDYSIATFLVGPQESPLRVTVSPVPGSLLSNLNRWRVLQLGLPPITEAQIDGVTREIQGQHASIRWVDFAGPGGKAPKMPPFAGTR